jgi:hypothetical protein
LTAEPETSQAGVIVRREVSGGDGLAGSGWEKICRPPYQRPKVEPRYETLKGIALAKNRSRCGEVIGEAAARVVVVRLGAPHRINRRGDSAAGTWPAISLHPRRGVRGARR